MKNVKCSGKNISNWTSRMSYIKKGTERGFHGKKQINADFIHARMNKKKQICLKIIPAIPNENSPYQLNYMFNS